MEMFNKKELDNRIGPLKKEKRLYELENIEGYVIRKCSEYGIESSYDVLAEEMPYFKTIGYTEFAGNFYLQPLNFKLRNEQLADAWHKNCSKCPKHDYAGFLIDNIQNNVANKYTERSQDFEKYPPKDYLVVLPGSNKIKTAYLGLLIGKNEINEDITFLWFCLPFINLFEVPVFPPIL